MQSWLYTICTHEATAVGIGGALGANARYWIGHWFATHTWAQQFPFGTILINISGSLLLGILSVFFLERTPAVHRLWILLLATGFCGGYTTFSTFEFETFRLIENGKWGWALANVLVSVIGGFAAVCFGVYGARQFLPK